MIFNSNLNIEVLKKIFSIIINLNKNDKNEHSLLNKEDFVIDIITFNRLKYYNKINKIREILNSCYIKKYNNYILREINYKDFLTIIRQLCKHFNIIYKINIKYLLNKKEIIYDVFYSDYCE